MGRIKLYTNISDDELQLIDEKIEKLGYANRTDAVTDILHAFAYGRRFREDTPEMNEITSFADEIDHLRDTFMDIVDEYAFPVVAMRGARAAFDALNEDLKKWMYERCQAVPLEEDMLKWMEIYYAVNTGRILRYRIQRMTEDYAEDYQED